jgi:hypothetical protein
MSKNVKSQFLDAGQDDPVADATAQAQGALQGAQNQAQAAANQATATATTAVTSALSGAGVPPGVTSAATNMMNSAAQQGFSTVMKAIGSVPAHIFGSLFHHHHKKKIHDIPAVQGAIAALPPAQQPGGVAAANLVAANMNGVTPPANLTPQAQAAYLVTHGMDSGSTPAQNAAVMSQIVAAGPAAKAGAVAALNDKDKFRYLAPAIGAAALGVGATMAGLALLPAIGVGAAGAGLVYFLRKKA